MPVPIELPHSLRADLHPVEEEVEDYRGLSHQQLLILMEQACRMAADIARSRPDAAAVFAWRDPVPASTRAAFARMGVAWGSP